MQEAEYINLTELVKLRTARDLIIECIFKDKKERLMFRGIANDLLKMINTREKNTLVF